MKVKYRIGDRLEFELEGAGQKELFKELASIQEIFGEEKCGMWRMQVLCPRRMYNK